MSEFAKVKRTPDDDDYVPPLPEVVIRFRRTLNDVKGSILESLAADGDQEASKLNNAVNKIQQLGNILEQIIIETDPENDSRSGGAQEAVVASDLMDYFEKGGVSFENMSTEERDLCITYIKIDIVMHPYDLSIAHINSQYKGRGGFYER